MKDFSNVLVFGLGASGKAMVAALKSRGYQVSGHDDFAQPEIEGVEVTTGLHISMQSAVERLQGVSLLCISPGVAPSCFMVKAAKQANIPIWSEPELAWQLNRGRTSCIVVTGTNGKTTTTQLISHCLDIPAIGNVGTPMVEVLASDDPPSAAVCELSSFQLYFTHSMHVQLAVLTNIAPDHLDWHGSYEAYQEAKSNAWNKQVPEKDHLFVLATEPDAIATIEAFPTQGVLHLVDPQTAPALALPGPHNQANAALAKAVCIAFGMPESLVNQRLSAFAPSEHRMELVTTYNDIMFVNDSKATNPHAAQAALQSFDSIIWIAGGLNKGLSFQPLTKFIPKPVKHTLTIGESGPQIYETIHAAGGAVTNCETMERAVEEAFALAQPGDCVLLSPAVASMDQFENYAERGRCFKTEVMKLVTKAR